jgi:hypothetical protein
MKKLDSVDFVYQEKMNELNTLKRINPDLEKEKEIMAQHDEMQMKALNRTKFMIREDNPTYAYSYLSSVAEGYAGSLHFDFRFEGTGTLLGTNFNRYSLQGKSNLYNLFRFLYHLENQSALLKVAGVELKETEEEIFEMRKKTTKKVKTLGFSVTLLAFYDSSGKTYEELALRNLSVPQLVANPFFAKIYPPEASKEDLHFINIDNAKIVGLSQDTVTLKEGNKIAVLQPGDKVLHGILQSINWEEEYVVFESDAMGVTVKAKLYLERE